MSGKQPECPICGKAKLLVSSIVSSERMQSSATSTRSVGLLTPSTACQPTHAPSQGSGLNSVIWMLAHLPTPWRRRSTTAGSRESDIATITTEAESRAASRDGEGQGEVDTPPARRARGYFPKRASHGTAPEHPDFLHLCSEHWSVGDRDRDRHWGAVVDADMLYIRALVDGVHTTYL